MLLSINVFMFIRRQMWQLIKQKNEIQSEKGVYKLLFTLFFLLKMDINSLYVVVDKLNLITLHNDFLF